MNDKTILGIAAALIFLGFGAIVVVSSTDKDPTVNNANSNTGNNFLNLISGGGCTKTRKTRNKKK